MAFDPELYRFIFQVTRPGYERDCVGMVIAQSGGYCLVATDANVNFVQQQFDWEGAVPVAGAGFTAASEFAYGDPDDPVVHGNWYLLVFNKTVPADQVLGLYCPTTYNPVPPGFPIFQSPTVENIHHYVGADPYSAPNTWQPYEERRPTRVYNETLPPSWSEEMDFYPQDGVGTDGTSSNPFVAEGPAGAGWVAAWAGSAKSRDDTSPFGITANSAHGLYAQWKALEATWPSLEPTIVGNPQSDPADIDAAGWADLTSRMNTYSWPASSGGALRVGAAPVTAIYLNGVGASAAYRGTQKVWEGS